MSQEKKILVSVDGGLQGNKLRNLHITVGLLSFSTMLFHFTSVYFFTLELKSVALVGIFLWLGNLFAFLFDIPIGILQYYLRAKTLYLLWVAAQVIAILIFGNFIFELTDFLTEPIGEKAGVLKSAIDFFLKDVLNLVLMVIAAMCYGFSKEVNDITNISYVLNNASPDQYKSIFAKNNIFFGIGSFLGLLVSGVILSTSPKFIIFHILFLIGIVFFMMYYYFDNANTTVNLKEVKSFQVYLTRGFLEKTKENVIQKVSHIDIKNTLQNTKYLFLRPVNISPDMISFWEMLQKTQENFKEIYQTLMFAGNRYLIVYWSCIMLLTFGFWDTFASTFLIDFLNQVKPGWSFALLGIIAIPAFGLQGIFGKLADVWGVYKIATFGLLLSASSLVLMWFFSGEAPNVWIVLGLSLINSVGYAICMGLSAATFLESYNSSYAELKNLKQIDANASAAPMKILQNFANVVGLFLGGIILKAFGYSWFFLCFGSCIVIFFIWSLKNRAKIQ